MWPADAGYICYLLVDEVKHLSEKRPVEGRVYLGSQFEGTVCHGGKGTVWGHIASAVKVPAEERGARLPA